MSAKKNGHGHANPLDLMRQQRAPREDGFNPIAPRTHRALMDYRHPEETRVVAWTLWRSIDVDRAGKLGAKKLRRTAYAHDERGVLGVQQIAADIGMTPANASDALKRCVEKGYLFRDEQGRIYPNGNAIDPILKKPQEKPKPLICTEIEEISEYLCTEIRDTGFRLYLQQLTISECVQRVAEHRRVTRIKNQILADAVAAARDEAEKLEREWQKSTGFTPETPLRPGRPKKPRQPLVVQLQMKPQFDLSVQMDSVQTGADTLNGNYSTSEQKEPSLFTSSEVSENVVREAFPPVRAALEHYATADDDAARQIVKACRAKAKDVTDEDIAGAIHDKMRDRRGIKNPIGFLLTAVPKVFERWQQPPQPTAAAAAAATVSLDAQIAQLEMMLREMPNHPQAGEFRAELDYLRGNVLMNGAGAGGA